MQERFVWRVPGDKISGTRRHLWQCQACSKPGKGRFSALSLTSSSLPSSHPPSSFSFYSLSSRNLKSTLLKLSKVRVSIIIPIQQTWNHPTCLRWICREVRGVSVWRSVYSNVVLRSSPIWMKTCGRLLFGRNLCGSSLCVAMWLRMLVGETINMAER